MAFATLIGLMLLMAGAVSVLESSGPQLGSAYADTRSESSGRIATEQGMEQALTTDGGKGPMRSVSYHWYDMFAHPLGPWYADRFLMYGDEYAATDSYPYLYVWEGSSPGNAQVNTFMQLTVDASDLPEVNMNENPEFLPYFGTARGGNAEINWHMDYATLDDITERVPGWMAYLDGWFIVLNGTVTLDAQAAMAVLGAPPDSLETVDGFDTWWASNGADVENDWELWLYYEAGNDRLATYNMYEYDLTFAYFEMDAEMVGEEILITFDTISWGMESLMTRWLHEAFMPTEWYMEDMYLNATIGPDDSDIYLTAAVGYALTASESIEDGSPCWTWQAMLQDFVESSPEYPISDFDPYVDLEYPITYPGNEWYHTMMPYDYTPGAWNLSEGETLTFEWPAGEQLFCLHDSEDIGGGTVEGTLDVYANMTVAYAGPMPADASEVVNIDRDNRRITYTGPFDMWTWSKTQTAHDHLASEWDRLGILPYGVPYIEFRAVDPDRNPPDPGFSVSPGTGGLSTVFEFDASLSSDSEDSTGALEVRWDWEDDGTWDTAWSTVKVAEHQYASPGTRTVSLEVRDTSMLTNQTSLQIEVLDDEPPLTTAAISGTAGEDGWYTSGIDVTLEAHDQWSAIDYTKCRVDGEEWTEYSEPIEISADGVHTFDYYSVDIIGNDETINEMIVEIDQTAPLLTISPIDDPRFTTVNVTIEWTCVEATSGLARVEYCLDDDVFISCENDGHVQLLNLSEGDHSLTLRAHDVAGNNVTAELQFEIDASSEGGILANPWAVAGIVVIAAAIAAIALVLSRVMRKDVPKP